MRQEIRSLTIAALTFIAFTCAPGVRAAVPDWVHQAAEKSVGTLDPEINAVVLLDEVKYTISGGDDILERYRRAVKIVRKEGREEGELSVWIEHQGKVLSVHAWSIDKSGREYELKDKDFAERTPYSYVLYDDVHLRTAQAPAADPGSLIAFEYEVRRNVWIKELNWFFQEENPVREARLILQMPVGWEYKDSWASATPVQPEPSSEGGLQWTVRDVPPIKREPRMPAFLSVSGQMELSYFGPGNNAGNVESWEALGRWYTGLTAGKRSPTPEISQKARELIGGKTDFDGKVRTLASFLQTDVRYVAIEIGIGGYQPHPAGDIFHARYGDCKDKATLLSSLLQEAGIRSEYVLINTNRGIVRSTSHSAIFNHAILAIELPATINADAYHSVIRTNAGKRYLIFDPTDEYTPLGDLRSELQDTYALLVTEAGGELIHTALQPPENNILVREGQFKLSPDGSLSGEVIEKRTGDHALYERYALKERNQQERLQRVERVLGHSLQGFTLKSLDIQQLDARDKDLELTYNFDVPNYVQVRGPLTLARPRILGEKTFVLDQKPRHYAIEMQSASRETDVFEIEIPPGYKVDDIPDPVKIDMGFASYQSKSEVTGTKLRYSREYIVRDLHVAPERLADLRKFEGMIGSDEMSAVVLTHEP
jgi:transglutaminase-like putative cysteine protease